MKRWVALCLVASLLFATRVYAEEGDAAADVQDDEYTDSEAAHLLVHKHVKNTGNLHYPLTILGRNVTVTTVIHNAGTRQEGESGTCLKGGLPVHRVDH